MILPHPPNPPLDLTGRQRRHLRSIAHSLSPLVQVGKDGLSDHLCAAVSHALEAHELIKVRVLPSAPLDRRAVAARLPGAVGAHLAGQVGRVVILYRRHKKNPRIDLPGSPARQPGTGN